MRRANPNKSLLKFKVSQKLSVKMNLGLPKLVDYHIMNNKRFVLTANEEGLAQLWQADTAECVKSFGTKKFQTVKE